MAKPKSSHPADQRLNWLLGSPDRRLDPKLENLARSSCASEILLAGEAKRHLTKRHQNKLQYHSRDGKRSTRCRWRGGRAREEYHRRHFLLCHRRQKKSKPLKTHTQNHKETLATRPASFSVYAPTKLHRRLPWVEAQPGPKTRHQALNPRRLVYSTPQRTTSHKPNIWRTGGESSKPTTTRLHHDDDDRSTSRDPPQPNPKTTTPFRRVPHRLVGTPERNHLPPDLFPLEVDLGSGERKPTRASYISTAKKSGKEKQRKNRERRRDPADAGARRLSDRGERNRLFFAFRESLPWRFSYTCYAFILRIGFSRVPYFPTYN